MTSSRRQRLSLFDGMARSGLTYEHVWIQQLSMGGTAGRLEVEAYILGLLRPDPYQHNLIAQSINEWFIDRGENHPVGYANDDA